MSAIKEFFMAKKSKSNKKAKSVVKANKKKKVSKPKPKAKAKVSKKIAKKKPKKVKPKRTLKKKALAKKSFKTKAAKKKKIKSGKLALRFSKGKNKPTAKIIIAKKEALKKSAKAPVLLPIENVEVPVVRKPGRQPKPKIKKIKKTFTPYNPIQIVAEKPVAKKEPKGKFEMEFVMRCSEPLLYDFFTAPSGLSEWFADNVNIRDGLYTFFWEGSKQEANLIALKEDSFAKYQWVDKNDGSYFLFRIQTDDLTGDVSLMITDFAETKDDETSARLLWETQVEKLKKKIGSFT